MSEIGKALMDRNMPPVAGQLSFSQELRGLTFISKTALLTPETFRQEITVSINGFREMTHPASKGEEAGKILAKYEELHAGLKM